MKKSTFFLLSLSIYLQAADMDDIFRQRFGEMGLGQSQQTNIAIALREQQFGKPFSTQYMNQLMQKEKDTLLSSSGLETSTIPISIAEAYNAGKFLLFTFIGGPQPSLILDPKEQHAKQHRQIRYINSADGLSQIPITVGMFSRGGFTKVTLDPDYVPPHIPLEEIDQATQQYIEEIGMYKSAIKMIQLQNTNIHKIYPKQLHAFPNVNKIILPTSTRQKFREENAERNPGITFIYQDEPIKI